MLLPNKAQALGSFIPDPCPRIKNDPQAKIENLDTRCAYRDTARIRSINSPSLLSEPQGADDNLWAASRDRVV